MGGVRINLTGRKFSRLLVLEYVGSSLWRCKCDCGNEALALGSQLRNERHKSCGCLKRERIIARSSKHGHKTRTGTTPTYQSWSNMIRRCTNPDHPRWADWGGRGITVDPRWLSFENFLADMGEKPAGLTLERKDNDGPYCATNCCWDTHHAQRINRRGTQVTPELTSDIVHLRGTGMTYAAIASELRVSKSTVGKILRSQR